MCTVSSQNRLDTYRPSDRLTAYTRGLITAMAPQPRVRQDVHVVLFAMGWLAVEYVKAGRGDASMLGASATVTQACEALDKAEDLPRRQRA